MKMGWLSPCGDFTPCESWEHLSVARNLIDEHGMAHVISDHWHADEVLLSAGWVRIGRYEGKQSIQWKMFRHLTEVQKTFLKPYFSDLNDLQVTDYSLLEWEYEMDGGRN